MITAKMLVRSAGLLLIPVVFLASGCSRGGAKPEARRNPKFAGIRQAGYPVTPEELNAWHTEPPAEDNAAPLYAEAFDGLAAVDSTSPNFLSQNQKAVDLLQKAAARAKCRYPVDLTEAGNVKLPHLAKLKKCAQLLSQSAVSHAGKGEVDQAIQSLLAGLRLARSVEGEPLLISHMVQIAAEGICQAAVESVLNRRALSEAQLARLQTAFREAENALSLTPSLAGERCIGIDAFERPAQLIQALAQSKGAGMTESEFEGYRRSAAYRADFDFFLDFMEQAITAEAEPFPGKLAKIDELKSRLEETKTKGYHVSGLFLPALLETWERAAEATARLRVVRTALAIEQYRLQHQNTPPDSLIQLSPQFLAVSPDDPFGGQPLHYKKKSGTSYVVYSIGKDRKDDGGKPRPTNANAQATFDLAFAVRR